MTISVEDFILAFRQITLTEMLVQTGRSREDDGEESKRTQKERRETSTGEVLKGMEKATTDRQKEWNEKVKEAVKAIQLKIDGVDKEILKLDADIKQKDEDLKLAAGSVDETKRITGEKELLQKALDAKKLERAKLAEEKKTEERKKVNLAHGLSGHGKGTDQLGRVLHGHRSDEAQESPPSSTVEIDGQKIGVYEEVGNDPSNTSGAFSSNEGMLETVNEAFAQAEMISRYSDSVRGTEKDHGLDQDRLGLTITGDLPLGDKIEVENAPKQTRGRKLQDKEIEERLKRVKKTEGVTNAQVIMDPDYVDDGKGGQRRAGWKMQTAYPVDDVPLSGSSYANHKEVENQIHDLERTKEDVEKRLPRLKEDLKTAEEAHKNKTTLLMRAKSNLVQATQKLAEEQGKVDKLGQDAKKAIDSLAGLSGNTDTLKGKEHLAGLGDLLGKNDEDLASAKATIEELIESLDEVAKECYKPSDDDFGFDKEPLDDRKDDLDVYNTALQALELLRQKIESFPERDKQARLKKEEEKNIVQEQENLDKDKDWPKVQEDVLTARTALENANKAHLDCRKAIHEKRAAHEEDYGMPEPSPVTEIYDPAAGKYPEDADRPEKPPILKGVDKDFDPLTAHHLYPWNKIRTDLNRALEKRDKSAMEKLFRFGEVKVSPDFWIELAKDPQLRDYSFNAQLHVAAQKICWSPRNIFMGPSGRGDDPGEEVDKTFDRSGIETLSSQLAAKIEEQGGLDPVLDEAEIRKALEEKAKQKALEEKAKKPAPVSKKMVEEEKKKRQAAVLKVQELLQEIEEEEEKRRKLVQDEIEQIEKEGPALERLTAKEVRQDLEKTATEAVKEEAVGEEVKRRKALARRLVKLRDLNQTQTKEYDPQDWTEKDGKPRQVHSP